MTKRKSTPRVIHNGFVAAMAISLLAATVVLRAQTLPPVPEYSYDVVSVRPSDAKEPGSRLGPGPQGGMRAQNVAVLMLLTFAYDVPASLLADVPDWVRSDRFDVTFTPDREESFGRPGVPREQMEGAIDRQRQRMQAVLRDRFGLVLRAESREMSLYSLTIAKGGSKLTDAANDAAGPQMMMGRGRITAKGADLVMLTRLLSNQLGRPVVDETGLTGKYDFVIEWTPDGPMMGPAGTPVPSGPGGPPPVGDAGGASIFTAITEQLGLKLDSRKGPVPVLVIEKIEKPEAN